MLTTTNEYLLLCVYSTLTLLSEGLYGEKVKKKNEYLLLCVYSSLTLLSEGLYGGKVKNNK
jgi:hypothetical protein